ncbi:MAG: hypothetical protein C3F13_03875 [Anaerolineales bacterium]|nr:hypothetical protein [Anaerolineae bacterium]PWB55814.1 MAG: hypothetical protein C3F13_03875 [Anaerolineales bacterium]
MKTPASFVLFILSALILTSCQGSSTTQLEATNQALVNQVNSMMTQLTQQASLPNQPATQQATAPTQATLPTVAPSPIPTSQSLQTEGVITPSLIVSGSGEITPWTNKTPYAMSLFGVANVHLLCDPADTTDGKVWIDDKTYKVSCNPNSESWIPWKQDITVGDHYIYSQNPADRYEFWTIGTTPFTIHNKFEGTDYMFNIPMAGIYNLTANLIKGAFNVYITCEDAQNFNYKIIQSTTIQVVLNPARCELIVRDAPPGTVTPGEIEVSLEFAK